VLKGHEPYPAVVVDRWWDLAAADAGIALFTAEVAPHLMEPPVNVLRVTLHPDGMAPGSTTCRSGGRTCSTACGGRSRSDATGAYLLNPTSPSSSASSDVPSPSNRTA
jgi:hypothetical protein